MKIAGVVFCDFETAPAGGPSQLRTRLAGRPILEHTLRRLMRVEGLAARCLFVQPRDAEVATDMLRSMGLEAAIEVVPGDPGVRPRRELLTAARKWNLNSWRGGLQGTTWFDEYVDPPTAGRAYNHYKPDGLMCFDGHQPVLDPAIASGMLAHLNRHQDECEFVFSQAPPGLGGIILLRAALEELLECGSPVGLLLSYRPEAAYPDPITHYSCYPLPPEVAQVAARFTGDTRPSRELLDAALADLGEDASGEMLCAWFVRTRQGPGELPVEVELELTTEDPLPETRLRPRGGRVPRRHLSDLDAVARWAAELGEYDDRRVWLGGHGDPLRHPAFPEVCGILRRAGIKAVGVATPLLDPTERVVEALFEYSIDVLEVQLDASKAAVYAQVHGADRFGDAYRNLARIEQVRRERLRPRPIVVPSLIRCAANLGCLEQFYETALRTIGSAVIRSHSTFGGLLPEDTLLSTTPPTRGPCRRLTTRLVLLANGQVVACDQDALGKHPIGDWTRQPLREIWGGQTMARLREAHATLQLSGWPLCGACGQWSRP